MVILGDKGLKLIRLSINGNNFYEKSYRLGGPWPPRPPTKSAPAIGGICDLFIYYLLLSTKAVDVSSLYQSSESTCKVNHRPISVATAMSKVFEHL